MCSNNLFRLPIIFCGISLLVSSCAGSRLGSRSQAEATTLVPRPAGEVITHAMLRQSSDQLLAVKDKDRGLSPESISTDVIGLAAGGIKNMIAAEKKRYTADYSFALDNLFFYNATSAHGHFDPVGMQFTGFRLVRTFRNEGKTDTALSATFEPDLGNTENILRDGIFTLRLTSLYINYAKAKIPLKGKHSINLDFEISFVCSYLTAGGELHRGEPLGTFVCNLRDVPVGGSRAVYDSFVTVPVNGRCFIVPRSYSFSTGEDGKTIPVYSRGLYSILVNVREASKEKFINKIVMDGSLLLLNGAAASSDE